MTPVQFAAFRASLDTFCTNPTKPDSNKLTSHLIYQRMEFSVGTEGMPLPKPPRIVGLAIGHGGPDDLNFE